MNDFPTDEDNVITDAAVVPNEEAIERQVPTVQSQVEGIVIHDQVSYSAAESISIFIKKMRKEINETFDPVIDAANKTHKLAIEKKKKYEVPMIEAEKKIKEKMGFFLSEQKKIQEKAALEAWEVEQEKIQLQMEALKKENDAKRKAEEERLRIEEEARIKIRQAEFLASKTTNEEDRNKAEARAMLVKLDVAAKAKEAEARFEAEQALLRKEAEARQVEIDKAAPAPAAKIETSGSSLREDWTFEIVNENDIPRTFLMVDEKKLGKYAKTMQKDADVAGVRFFAKPGINQRIK